MEKTMVHSSIKLAGKILLNPDIRAPSPDQASYTIHWRRDFLLANSSFKWHLVFRLYLKKKILSHLYDTYPIYRSYHL